MSINKYVLIPLLLLSIIFIYQLGIQNLIIVLISSIIGYSLAKYILNDNISLPGYRSIEKKKHNLNQFKEFEFDKKSSKNIKGSSSTSSLPLYKSSQTCLESNFKRAYPWQSVYLPDIVDKSIEDFLSKIIQNFVLTWYNKISVDDGLVYEIKSIFRHILANFIERAKQVDLKHLITFKLNGLLYNHIAEFNEFYTNSPQDFRNVNTLNERLVKQFEFFGQIIEKTEQKSQVHFALTSRKNELKYLRQVCKQILPFLLPESVLKCKVTLELIEEISVGNLLLRGLDILAEPKTINKIFIKSIQSHKENEPILIESNRAYVQLLKHWCQMNGRIFRSILSPNLDEIIENNDLLHVFINYLNTSNSLPVLQLYLMMRGIQKSFEEVTNEFSNNVNMNSQIEELKNWCHQNKSLLETISFDYRKSFFDVLENFITNVWNSNEQKISREVINQIHDVLYEFIKETYYTQFIKSEFMYKNLVGLHKINSSANRKKKDRSSDTRSEHENNLLIIDEYETDDLSLNENHFIYSKKDQTFETNEEIEFDEFENFEDDFTNKVNTDVRLDLINEIKDEFSDTNDSIEVQNETVKSSHNEEDDELDEDEDDSESPNEEINLNNLRIAIDEIEELVDRANKTCQVFVIQVWTIEPKKPGQEQIQDSPIWCVKRKYDEFYVLDTRLKEFHGELISNLEYNVNNPNQITVQLPPKQRALFFLSNSKNFEYLNSVKNDFAKYLQSLLTNPILSMSQLIKSFLDPKSIEFSSSIFNDISNIGKMVKGVPYKLRVERGQSLDPFLINLLKSVKQPNPKGGNKPTSKEEITERLLNNPLYSDEANKSIEKHPKSPAFTFDDMVTPFESFIFLIKEVYQVPRWLCLIVFSLKNLIQNSFDSFIYWTVSKKVDDLTKAEHLSKFIRLFKDLIFENENKKEESSEDLHKMAFEFINEFIHDEFLTVIYKIPFVPSDKINGGIHDGTKLFLESFQYPIWNKHLTYQILDVLIEELFPELTKK